MYIGYNSNIVICNFVQSSGHLAWIHLLPYVAPIPIFEASEHILVRCRESNLPEKSNAVILFQELKPYGHIGLCVFSKSNRIVWFFHPIPKLMSLRKNGFVGMTVEA